MIDSFQYFRSLISSVSPPPPVFIFFYKQSASNLAVRSHHLYRLSINNKRWV